MIKNLFKSIPITWLKYKIRNTFYAVNYLLTVSEKQAKVYPTIHFTRDNSKDFLIRVKDLSILSDDAINIISYLRKFEIKPGDVVVDAGAYRGLFTIIASKLVGRSGKVVSFEPDTENYKKLLNSIKQYRLKNVIPSRKGLWSRDKVLKFSNVHAGDSTVYTKKGDRTVNINCVSLDNEVKRLGIKKVNFIKMDIEGAELEALKGSLNLLQKNDVKLVIASYHKLNGKKTFASVEHFLKNLGFSVETSFPEHLTTYAEKKSLF